MNAEARLGATSGIAVDRVAAFSCKPTPADSSLTGFSRRVAGHLLAVFLALVGKETR